MILLYQLSRLQLKQINFTLAFLELLIVLSQDRYNLFKMDLAHSAMVQVEGITK